MKISEVWTDLDGDTSYS